MDKETREELKVRYMIVVLELASQLGGTKICKEFDVPRSTGPALS